MFRSELMLFLLYSCCLFYYVSTTDLPTEVPSGVVNGVNAVNNANGTTIVTYVCDDEIVQTIEKRLEHLLISNEVMRAKLDLLKLKFEHQASEKNLLILTEFQKLKADLEPKPIEPKEATVPTIPPSCAAAMISSTKSGIYRIQPDPNVDPMFVWCELDQYAGAAWTIIQRRYDGSTDFYRNWEDYEQGFGNIAGEFFLGLQKLHLITKTSLQELWIHLVDFDNVTRYARYDAFAIGNEQQSYAMHVLGQYSGDAGDSLSYHQGMKFTTKDKHNDENRSNCATSYKGGWWYYKCHSSNLNGQYLHGAYSKEQYGKGIDWNSWHGHTYSLKNVHMALRPAKLH